MNNPERIDEEISKFVDKFVDWNGHVHKKQLIEVIVDLINVLKIYESRIENLENRIYNMKDVT